MIVMHRTSFDGFFHRRSRLRKARCCELILTERRLRSLSKSRFENSLRFQQILGEVNVQSAMETVVRILDESSITLARMEPKIADRISGTVEKHRQAKLFPAAKM